MWREGPLFVGCRGAFVRMVFVAALAPFRQIEVGDFLPSCLDKEIAGFLDICIPKLAITSLPCFVVCGWRQALGNTFSLS